MFWVLLLLAVASFFLTQLLAPKPDVENARPSKLGDLRFPRATSGAPIPIVFGKVRVRAPNTLWFGNFKAIANTVKIKTGMFSSKDQITGYDYCVTIDLAICLGPNVTLHKIWAEKKLLAAPGGGLNGDGIAQVIHQSGLFGGPQKGGGMDGNIRWYSGGFTQSRNAYIAALASSGAKLPGYVGVAHCVFENRNYTVKLPFNLGTKPVTTPFYIGTSASLRALSFEVSRYPDNLGLGASRIIGEDLNPAEAAYSALVEGWGIPPVDPAKLETASFAACGATLFTEGLGISLLVQASLQRREVLSEILRQADGILYQDPVTGKINMRLIRADYSVPSLPVFDEDDIEAVTSFSRTSWSETLNQVRVIYNARTKQYNEAVAFAQDPANIATQGGRVRGADVSFPGCTTEANAVKLGTRELSQQSVPLFRATLRMKRIATTLKPGDLFVWSWSEYLISSVVMRVQRFDAGELVNGNVVVDCIQDRFGVATAVFGTPATGLDDPGDNVAQNIVKWNVFESPYIFVTRLEAPFVVKPDSVYLWALARDPNGRHDGYSLITSLDNFVDSIVTEINRTIFPYSVELITAVLKTQGQDDGVLGKLVVRLPNPEGAVFDTATLTQIRTDGRNLLYMNGEFLAYESFTDNLDGTYDLNTVHRALLDSTFVDHASLSVCYLMYGVEWLSQTANADTGTIYYQLPSHTATSSQALGDFATQSLTRAQRYDKPLPPDFMKLESVRAPIEILSVTSVNITDFLERDRTDNEFTLVDDSTDTPEAATTYNARLYLDGVLLASASALTLASLPVNLAGLFGAGTGRVELEAVRGGLISWTVEWLEFFYANYLSLSAERLTNGGFEAALGAEWTNVSGTWARVTTAHPLNFVRTVGAAGDDDQIESTGAGANERKQDYTIPGADASKSAIVRIRKGGKNGTTLAQVIVELRNGGGVLKSVTTPSAAAALGQWENIEVPVSLRSDATILRVRLLATGAGGTFDNVSVRNHTTSPLSTLTYNTVAGVTPRGIYALRKAHSTYAGALVRIRDTFDNTEQDVGFDLDGNMEPFFVRGEARVVTWYDQSASAVNLSAASNAKQPRLYWNLSETGRHYIDYSGGCALRDGTAGTGRPYMTARPNLIAALGPKRDAAAAFLITIPHQDATHSSPFYRWGVATTGTDYRWSVDGTEENDPGNSAINSGKHVVCIDYQNGNLYENDDAVAADTFAAANITYPNSTRLRIGEDAAGGNPWTGTLSEFCIYDGNIAAGDRKTMMEALALYWYNLSI